MMRCTEKQRWAVRWLGREASQVAVERILGIDPGSVITGWGIIEGTHSRITHIDNGGIFTRQKAFHQRLREIHDGLQKVIYEYQPTLVSMEQVFVSKNAQSALKLGQARGVALIVALNADLTVHEYTPTAVKLAVTGRGKADKSQVGAMVQTLLGLPEPAQVDASDALACAICHMLRPATPLQAANGAGALSPAAAMLAEALKQEKGSRRRRRR